MQWKAIQMILKNPVDMTNKVVLTVKSLLVFW